MSVKAARADRRAFPRIRAEFTVELSRPEHFNPGAPGFEATLLDISQSGALLLSPVEIPRGEWFIIRPDQRGPGFGTEVTAIVDRALPASDGRSKLVCRFPQPVDYSVLRLFM